MIIERETLEKIQSALEKLLYLKECWDKSAKNRGHDAYYSFVRNCHEDWEEAQTVKVELNKILEKNNDQN
jgi:hypothetical protein